MSDLFHMKAVAGVALLGAVSFTAADADAGMMIKLESGVDTLEVTDEGAGDLDPGNVGSILVSGPVGVYGTTFSAGLGTPFIGGDLPEMRLNNLSVNSSGPGSLTVSLTLTDIVGEIGDVPSLLQVGGVSGGNIEISAYADSTNTAYGTQTLLGNYTHGTGSFSQDIADQFASDEAYSLTLIANITHTRATQTTSFNADLGVVPEPSTMALIGLGGLLVARRRRR